MEVEWKDGYEIRVKICGGSGVLSANREGLESLAGLLGKLADEGKGSHIHLDEYNSLEEGSAEFIIELAE